MSLFVSLNESILSASAVFFAISVVSVVVWLWAEVDDNKCKLGCSILKLDFYFCCDCLFSFFCRYFISRFLIWLAFLIQVILFSETAFSSFIWIYSFFISSDKAFFKFINCSSYLLFFLSFHSSWIMNLSFSFCNGF